MPSARTAMFYGTVAYSPRATAAGSSQPGRIGCSSANRSKRRSALLIRHITVKNLIEIPVIK